MKENVGRAAKNNRKHGIQSTKQKLSMAGAFLETNSIFAIQHHFARLCCPFQNCVGKDICCILKILATGFIDIDIDSKNIPFISCNMLLNIYSKGKSMCLLNSSDIRFIISFASHNPAWHRRPGWSWLVECAPRSPRGWSWSLIEVRGSCKLPL